MATLKQRLHRKNGTSYDTIHLETNATVVKMSTTDDTTVSNKLTTVDNSISSLNTEMNSLKSSVSSGKAQIASAITDKGVSTSASDSFSQMATNISQIKTGINGVPVYGTDFTYTGNYQIISEDDSGNWKIKFLTSGTFTAMNDVLIDIFAVGGGGSGGLSIGGLSTSSLAAGSGGGSGYTKTSKNILAVKNTSYSIVIGTGGSASNGASYETAGGYDGNNGGNTSGFNITANGGFGGKKRGNASYATSYRGGNGGSGGGGCDKSSGYNGGSDGSDGSCGSYDTKGYGQGTTTREFGETNGVLYAGGGGAGAGKTANTAGKGGDGGGGSGVSGGANCAGSSIDGTANTGGGGGGNHVTQFSGGFSYNFPAAGKGGSGILVIRNAR